MAFEVDVALEAVAFAAAALDVVAFEVAVLPVAGFFITGLPDRSTVALRFDAFVVDVVLRAEFLAREDEGPALPFALELLPLRPGSLGASLSVDRSLASTSMISTSIFGGITNAWQMSNN